MGAGSLEERMQVLSKRPRFSRLHLFPLAVALLTVGTPLLGQSIVALPYVQPGDAAGPAGADDKQIRWVTDQVAAEYTVEYGWEGSPARRATVTRVAIDLKPPSPEVIQKEIEKAKKSADPDDVVQAGPILDQHLFSYRASLAGLPPDTKVWYRVKKQNEVLREASFRSRASADKPIRFIAVGDLANGKEGQNAIAYQISVVKPDFLVGLGDIVYPNGRVSQYTDHFWRTYDNAASASVKTGAPLMASVPFHVLPGNHDVDTSLSIYPDALGIYYFFHAPANGPGTGKWNTPIGRDKEQVAAFRAAAGDSYPSLAFYSFDEGPAHFLMLDNSGYVKLDSPELLKWIESDLSASKAKWKFVCCHAPAFQSSPQHYSEQKMRLLVPLLERLGVDIVFAGHVHNYQRSFPIRFTPGPRPAVEKLVGGTFAIDSRFDGKESTKAQGIIHIVSGGGGGTLYKDPLDKSAKALKEKFGDNWAPYTAKYVADRHSFVVCELSADRLVLRAIDADGTEIDRAAITK
jgi:3',5'-cyclic AMP phosphodiesterase CpdA